MLTRMKLRALRPAVLIAAWLACAAVCALAVPLGYRYVGSRVVSEGRVVLWYWNVDHVEIGSHGLAFVAHMYARAVDVGQERAFVAIVRCDSRTYRSVDSRGAYESIDDDEPIFAVWRAGCDNGVALNAAQRYARLNSATVAQGPQATPVAATPPAPPSLAQAAAPAKPEQEADPRRADACVKFSETRGALAGDATITNACTYPIEVTLCYKGGGRGAFDCPKGRHGDRLGAAITHVLPEYRRGRHKGITAVACKGDAGPVFPRLDDSGKGGCF
jgi:hypothetical protein